MIGMPVMMVMEHMSTTTITGMAPAMIITMIMVVPATFMRRRASAKPSRSGSP